MVFSSFQQKNNLASNSSTNACKIVLVELEGIEPSSKRRVNLLSTRLSPLRFSCVGKTGATNQRLILLNFAKMPRHTLTIPDILSTATMKPPRKKRLFRAMSRSASWRRN